MELYENKPNLAFWSKSDLIDLMEDLELIESVNDAVEWSTLISFDDLCEFVCYLLCGGYGQSRNIHVLDEELQNDQRVIALFEYCDNHCER